MQIITYLKPVPFMKRLFGIVLLLFALYTMITVSLTMPLIFLILGGYFVSTEGSQVNLTSKTYRKIWSIFGIHFGKWKPCPDFEYVSVFRTHERQGVNVITASASVRNEVILLNFFYGNKNVTLYKTTDKADAFKVAEHFKRAFNIDILDATGPEKVWL